MPKKIEKAIVKKATKTETKKVKVKKPIKIVAKTAPKLSKKVAPITKKIQSDDNMFGVKNILAIIGIIVLLLGMAYLINTIQLKSINKPANIAKPQTFSYDCPAGKNALEVLKANSTVDAQTTDAGVYVTSINGIGENNGSYWLYYINDQPGTISPDKYNCADGDKVEWRLEQLL